MKNAKIVSTALIFFSCANLANAYFEVPDAPINSAIVANEHKKIFKKNMQDFAAFLAAQDAFSPEIRFVMPILDEDNFSIKNEVCKNGAVRLLVKALYFNILRDEKLLDLQKQEISLQKELFDSQRKYASLKELQEMNEAYTQAQMDYLAYKKMTQMTKLQLKSFSGVGFDGAENIDNFNLSFACNDMRGLIFGRKLSPYEADIVDNFRYEFEKYQNLSDRIEKQSQLPPPRDSVSALKIRLDLVELEKEMVSEKLRCIVFYFSLKDYFISANESS